MRAALVSVGRLAHGRLEQTRVVRVALIVGEMRAVLVGVDQHRLVRLDLVHHDVEQMVVEPRRRDVFAERVETVDVARFRRGHEVLQLAGVVIEAGLAVDIDGAEARLLGELPQRRLAQHGAPDGVLLGAETQDGVGIVAAVAAGHRRAEVDDLVLQAGELRRIGIAGRPIDVVAAHAFADHHDDAFDRRRWLSGAAVSARGVNGPFQASCTFWRCGSGLAATLEPSTIPTDNGSN